MQIWTKLMGAAVLLSLGVSGAEGTRVCMGGDLDQLNSAQLQSCQTAVAQVRETAARYSLSSWHFVVVCDEKGWEDYSAFSDKPATALQTLSADTNISLHTTFLRGSRLIGPAATMILSTEMASIARAGREQIAEVR